MSAKPLIIILGATASGKTKLAVNVAQKLNAEIISADSRQIFKGMDIGTGKDLNEYIVNGETIPYHLIDILPAGARYNVDAFKNDFYTSFIDITDRKKLPILCGGTGMYIHSILQNQTYTSVPVNLALRLKLELLDKDELISKLNTHVQKLDYKVDISSKKRLIRALEIKEYLQNNNLEIVDRPEILPIVFGLKNEVEITRKNILKRLDFRLNNGMIDEVINLLDNGLPHNDLVFYGLEYKFISAFLLNEISFDELKEKLGIAICQYAKRQNTFFRKMEKDGVLINWLKADQDLNILVQELLEKLKLNKTIAK
jgi:tRNA dimethylallyltransferase